jgi:hypothetical protein
MRDQLRVEAKLLNFFAGLAVIGGRGGRRQQELSLSLRAVPFDRDFSQERVVVPFRMHRDSC